MEPLSLILTGLFAYLIGATPCGLLIARMRGVDIRKVGSGNIGATNVFRCVGKSWGILAFVLDFIKGFAPAFWLPGLFLESPAPYVGIMTGALAVVGHNWPVWLKFKGGKGVATSAGMLAGIAPWTILTGLVTWILAMVLTRIVSVASMAAAVAVIITGWIAYNEPGQLLLPVVLTVLGLLVIVRHRHNISRLLRGEEHRFGKKKTGTPAPQDSAKENT